MLNSAYDSDVGGLLNMLLVTLDRSLWFSAIVQVL